MRRQDPRLPRLPNVRRFCIFDPRSDVASTRLALTMQLGVLAADRINTCGTTQPEIFYSTSAVCSFTLGYDVVAESTPTGVAGSGEMCLSSVLWYDGQSMIPCCRQKTTVDICDQQRHPKRLAKGRVCEEDAVSPLSRFFRRAVEHI